MTGNNNLDYTDDPEYKAFQAFLDGHIQIKVVTITQAYSDPKKQGWCYVRFANRATSGLMREREARKIARKYEGQVIGRELEKYRDREIVYKEDND